MYEEDMDLAIKVVVVGNGAVGKSSMIQRYCSGVFTREYKKTIGVDFLEKTINVFNMDPVNNTRPSVCFAIEKVVAISIGIGNEKYYQVQWAPSWVSGINLIGCEHLIEEFLQKQQYAETVCDDVLDTMVQNELSDSVNSNIDNDNNYSTTIESDELDNIVKIEASTDNDDESMSLNIHQAQSEYVPENAVHEYEDSFKTYDHLENEQDKQDNYNYSMVENVHSDNNLVLVTFNVNEDERLADDQSTSRVEEKKRKKHRCIHCEKVFQRPCQLAIHVRSHMGEKPFTCPVCSKRFLTKGNLQAHARTHDRTHDAEVEKPFPCTMCSKSFVTNGSLQRHAKLHINKESFECDQCAKSFGYRSTLRRHLLTHS